MSTKVGVEIGLSTIIVNGSLSNQRCAQENCSESKFHFVCCFFFSKINRVFPAAFKIKEFRE